MRRQRLIVEEDIRVHKGVHFVLLPHDVATEEARQQARKKQSKGHSKPTFTCLPDSSHIVPTMSQWQHWLQK
jgi:hypothetical protein